MPQKKEKEFDFVCAGHLCIDIFPDMDQIEVKSLGEILHPGSLVKTGKLRFSCGGSVNNTGQALRSLGHNVFFSALVGDDILGKIVIDSLKKSGNTSGIRKNSELSTSYSIVLDPKGTDRSFLHHSGANEHFGFADIDFEKVANAKHFHLGYPTLMKQLYRECGSELIHIFEKAKASGASTSLDLAMVKPDDHCFSENWNFIFEHLLPNVDFLLPSIEETLLLWRPDIYAEIRKGFSGEIIDHIDTEIFRSIAEDFIGLGCGTVMLKAGNQGFYFRTGGKNRLSQCSAIESDKVDSWSDRETWCPTFPPEKICSTTAAGDVCIAGFLSALISSGNYTECILSGAMIASLRIAKKEIADALPTIEECFQLIRDNRMLPRKESIGNRQLGNNWKFDTNTCTYYPEN